MKRKICKLCDLPIEPGLQRLHHLTPRQLKRQYGNTGKIKVHVFCHAMIHVFFSNLELAENYNTIAKLKDNPIIQRFRSFIRNSPTLFYLNSQYATKFVKRTKETILLELE